MDRFQEARLIAPGVVGAALNEIVRLYGHTEAVEPIMDRFLQALLSGPSATEDALDEIIFWCGRKGEAAEA